jgi:hypothetical protein
MTRPLPPPMTGPATGAKTGRAWIDSLPAELAGQREISRRLLALCEADDRIRWLVIGCSLGRGAADRLSDLDMAAGVMDAEFDAALADIRMAAAGLGDLVDSYHHQLAYVSGTHERIFAQYADRCQLDLVVLPASVAVGRGQRGMVVLYDPDGMVAVGGEPAQVTPGQVREWAFDGWCQLADVGKYLRRGSAWEALEQLHAARTSYWRLWAVAHAVPDARYGITSVLDFARHQLPAEVAATVPELDLAQLTWAARRLAGLLADVGAQLPAEHLAVLPGPMAAYITADLAAIPVAGRRA